jgi:hypothetical protein
MVLTALTTKAQIETRSLVKSLPAENSCCTVLTSASQKGQVLLSNGTGVAPSWGNISFPPPAPAPVGTKSFSGTGPYYCSGLPSNKNQKQWVPFNNSTLTVTARTTSNILISSSIMGADSRNSVAGIAVGNVGCEITVQVDNTIYEYNIDNYSLGLAKIVTGAMTSGATSISNFSVQVPPGTHTITLLARNDGYNDVIAHLGAVYLTALVVPVN